MINRTKLKKRVFNLSKKYKGGNPLKADPTRTLSLRLAAVRAVGRKFRILKGKLVKLILVEDALGLKDRKPPSFNVENWCNQYGGDTCSTGEKRASLSEKAIALVKSKYLKFSERYGKRGAIAIMAAMAVTMPLPGNIFAVLGIAEGVRFVVGKLTHNESYGVSDDLLDDVRRLAEELGLGFDAKSFSQEYARQLGKLTDNSFCPTGEGGGVDPSCSPGQRNIEIHDPKTGEVFWTGKREEAESMLREQSKEEPNHGLEIRTAIKTPQEREADRVSAIQKIEEDNRTRMQEKDRAASLVTPSGLLPGHPDFMSPPERLYHATFSAKSIEKEGFKSGDELGSQTLGGTSSHLVSFTTKENADNYAKALEVAQRGARGELSKDDLRQIGTRYGASSREVSRLLAESRGDRAKVAFDVLRGISLDGKKFPLFMGGSWPSHIATADSPRVVSIQSKGLGHVTYNPGETEWRVGDKGLTTNRWQFATSPDKIAEFTKWLREQFNADLLGKNDEQMWADFARRGFERGAGRAFDDVNKSRRWKPGEGEFYRGSRDSFLRQSFGHPETKEKLQLLASRSFTDLRNVTEDMATRMGRRLMDGLAQGQNPREMIDGLVEDLGVSEARAETIARTEIIRSHAEGQLDAMERMGVEEVGVAVEWSTARDLRVCPKCSSLEGIVLTIEEAHGLIPAHPNCLPGDSLVLSRSQIAAVSKRDYDGDMVVVRTASGRELSCTPNHPVLTDLGWVPSGRLDVGSYVICDGGSEWEPLMNREYEHVPTRIKEIADAFRGSPHVVSAEMPVSSPDFHGDGIGSEVAVIWSDSQLRSTFDSSILQELAEQPFVVRHVDSGISLSGLRRQGLLLDRLLSASCSVISSGYLILDLFRRHLRPFQGLRLALTSPSDSSSYQSSSNGSSGYPQTNGYDVLRVPLYVRGDDSLGVDPIQSPRRIVPPKNSDDNFVRDSKLASEITSGDAGPVFLDQVVSVRVDRYIGHVYNLETGDGYYSANGIITHNCRCAFLPANVGEDDSKQKRSKQEILDAFEEADVEAPELDDERPKPLVEPTKNELYEFSRLILPRR